MGTEIVFLVAALFSTLLLMWLVVRSWLRASRPYALPTLTISVLVALVWARFDSPTQHYWAYALIWFGPAAVVLGLHAHAIKWLVTRAQHAAAP